MGNGDRAGDVRNGRSRAAPAHDRDGTGTAGLYLTVAGIVLLAAPLQLQTFLAIMGVAAAIAWWLCGLLPGSAGRDG